MATVSSAGSVDGASLGDLLRRAREQRGLTLQQLASETKIPLRHLEALEHGGLTAMAAGFYQRAEIRTYARAVGLDQHLVLARLESTPKAADSRTAARAVPLHDDSPSSRGYILVVLALIAAAAVVFGRTMLDRTPALAGSVPGVTEPAPESAPPGGDAPDHATIQQDEDSAPVAAPAREPPAAALTPGRERPARPEDADARSAPAPVSELVVVTDPPGARVTVNGIGWGLSPVTIRYLPPGDKRVRVSKEGYAAEERVVRLDEGRRRSLDIPLTSAP